MKILIAAHTYYPEQNGVAIVTQYIAEGLANNHEVVVITDRKGKYDRIDYYKNVRIERINVKCVRQKFKGDKNYYWKRIKIFKPDCFICVCTQTWTFDWIAKKLGITENCVNVLYTHGYSGYFEKYPILIELLHGRYQKAKCYYRWKKYYQKAYLYIRKFDLVTYLSENNSAALYAHKYGLENGIVLENAVDNRIFEKEKLKKEKYGTDYIIYLCIANYDENKNQEVLIKAFYELPSENKKLILIGSSRNAYSEELNRLKDELNEKKGKHKLDILFGLERKEVLDLLAKADIFIFASKKEQYPMVLCEAAAMGIPIISSDTGHAASLPGALIFHHEIELKDKMQYLSENKKVRMELGRLNKKFAQQHYQIEEKVKELEGWIVKIQKKKQGSV